uniref:Apolipoprotein E n=1 Tax=Chelonoidis abingdonii TaxID=106734 RepID=A0A8C0J7P8_CHEAB
MAWVTQKVRPDSLPANSAPPGCQANPIVQDEPKTNGVWMSVTIALHGLITDTMARVGDGASQDTPALTPRSLPSGLITDTMAEVEVYREQLRAQLGPYAQEAQQRLGSEVAALTGKLRADMEEAKGRLVQYTGDVRLMFDQNLEEVRARVGMYLRKLRKRLGKDAEELRHKMATYADEVQAHTGHRVDAVRQGLLGIRAAEQVRQWFAPFLQDVRAQLQTLVEKLQGKLQL